MIIEGISEFELGYSTLTEGRKATITQFDIGKKYKITIEEIIDEK